MEFFPECFAYPFATPFAAPLEFSGLRGISLLAGMEVGSRPKVWASVAEGFRRKNMYMSADIELSAL